MKGLVCSACVVAVLCGAGWAQGWEDYGQVWAPVTGVISLQCVVADVERFGETGSVPSAAPLYKMYYSNGIYPECNQIHLAASPDGVMWAFVGPVKDEGKRPVVAYSPVGFGEGEARYKMWYTVASTEEERWRTASWRVCESADGVTWTESVSCEDGEATKRLVEPEEPEAWNRGSYGPLRVLFNPDGPAEVNLAEPLSNRYAMYYNVYGVDEVAEAEGLPRVTVSVALAVSVDGVKWYCASDGPVLRGLPSVTGGMLSYADVARVDGGYVMVLLTESHPAAGYVRSIAQAHSADGVHWTVVRKDVATLKTTDEDKGTYGVSVAVDPMTGAIQVWLAAADGEGRLAIRYGRWEQ